MLHGQDTNNPQALMLGTNNTVYGSTPAVLTKPAGKSKLMLMTDKGDWNVRLGDCTVKTFESVDPTTEQVTITGHGLANGQGPVQVANSGGALPTGLSGSTDYWIIKVDANKIKFATSEANALAGTAVNITGAGTGTNTIAANMPAAAVATSAITNGSGGNLIKEGKQVQVTADVITVKGYAADSVLSYFWF